MAQIAMDEKHSPELRGRMYAELAQYVYPKRKAVEHTGAGGELASAPVTLNVNFVPPKPPDETGSA
jgi:hypothetical protein